MKQFISPCVTPVSSECVLYTGQDLKNSEIDPTCLPSITTVLENLDSTIDLINKSIDIKSLQTDLTLNLDKAKVKDLFQAILTSLTSLKTDVKALKTNTGQDLLATPVQIDLSCLGSSCDTSSASTLLTIISLLTSEICALKAQTNSNNLYYQQPI